MDDMPLVSKNHIAYVLRGLREEVDRGAFVDGLDKWIHRAFDDPVAGVAGLRTFVAQWVTSVALISDEEWQRQAAEAQALIESGEPLRSVSHEELLRMVRR